MRLYKSLRPSVRPSVHPSVGPSVAVYKNKPNCHNKAIIALYCPCPTARNWAYAVYMALLAWGYPLGRNLEIQNFLALGPLGGVLWAFQNLAIFGYQYFLNGHNFGSTNDRKLVLVSNIRFWDRRSKKSFQKFFLMYGCLSRGKFHDWMTFKRLKILS